MLRSKFPGIKAFVHTVASGSMAATLLARMADDSSEHVRNFHEEEATRVWLWAGWFCKTASRFPMLRKLRS